MLHSRRLFITLLITVFLPSSYSDLHGQSSVGIQPFGSYYGNFDQIDAAKLALHIDIPLYSHAGRGQGTQVGFHLIYDTNFQDMGGTNFAIYSQGWNLTGGIETSGSVVSIPADPLACTTDSGSPDYNKTIQAYYWYYVDSTGYYHPFGSTQVSYCSGEPITSLHNLATDGSGYFLDVTGAGIFPSAKITMPSGTTLQNVALTDTNGNAVAGYANDFNTGYTGTYSITDTVGGYAYGSGGTYVKSNPLAADDDETSWVSRTPFVIQYHDTEGHTQSVTVTFVMYKVNLANLGMPAGATENIGLVDKVTFPDGTYYQFTYEPSATTSGATTGQLASVKLLSGGIISYQYTYGSLVNTRTALSRTTTDGTTSYNSSVLANYSSSSAPLSTQTTISKPAGSESVTFEYSLLGNSYETAHVWKDLSGTTLKSSMKCYNGATGNCTSTAVSEPLTEITTTTTLDTGQNSKQDQFFNAFQLPVELDEYDYGATSPTRKTITTYASLGNNISDRPSSVIIYNGTSMAKKTTFDYDTTALATAPSGVPGLGSVTGARGNLTAKHEWLNASSYVTTTYTYDTAGQLMSVQDPAMNTTSFGYDSATDAFLVSTTQPQTNGVNHSETYQIDPTTGFRTSLTDENNQTTMYYYWPSLRPRETVNLNGTTVMADMKYTYTSNSATKEELLQGTTWLSTVQQYDSYGRLLHSTDPSGATTDYTYDTSGRLLSTSNPHFASPSSTDGVTTYAYDGIDRMRFQCHPDNGNNTPCVAGSSYLEWLYSGNITTSYDENRNAWARTTDALGRLVKVIEPGILTTTYTYDILGDLTCADQWGTSGAGSACSSSRSRNFSYDWLSRLNSASNPETGPVSYSYVNPAGGGYCAGEMSLPCSKTDAAGTTTTYVYDNLNRLISKSAPITGTSPLRTMSSCYQYDGLVKNNAIGRLVNEWTQESSCPSPSIMPATGVLTSKSVIDYDSLGRVSHLQQCVLKFCTPAAPNAMLQTYNAASDLTLWTDGLGATMFTKSYDSSGRFLNITSSWSDATHPATLFSVQETSPIGNPPAGCTTGYSPAGGLQNWTLGTSLSLVRCYDSRLRPWMEKVTSY